MTTSLIVTTTTIEMVKLTAEMIIVINDNKDD